MISMEIYSKRILLKKFYMKFLYKDISYFDTSNILPNFDFSK
jgi:hypothetical protein